jgi:hypothetical protein
MDPGRTGNSGGQRIGTGVKTVLVAAALALGVGFPALDPSGDKPGAASSASADMAAWQRVGAPISRESVPCRLGVRPAGTEPPAAGGGPLVARRPDGHLQFGFNDQAWFERRLTLGQDRAAHEIAGSTVLRYTLLWGQIERQPGVYDWAPIDAMYCNALRAALHPILVITSSPAWAVTSLEGCAVGRPYCHAPPAPVFDGALQRFARAAAIRYPLAAGIESWNEPNLKFFWPRPDPRRYVGVMRAIYLGAKAGNPAIPVVGGNLGNGEKGMAPAAFLGAMYDAGAAGLMDALGLHPYPAWGQAAGSKDLFHTTLADVRSLVAARDRPGRRLWINELAVEAVPRTQAAATARQQSQLTGYYDELDAAPDVDVVVFHTLLDDHGYGWLTRRLGVVNTSPVFCAFARRFGQPPKVCPGPVALNPNP